MLTISDTLILPENDNAPNLYDIGWGLARMGRFAGQTKQTYSVLPHTYVVASLVPPEHKLDAMLHDASEIVISDQVSTWKNDLTKADEREIQRRIYNSLGLEYDFDEEVIKKADLHARAVEAMLLGHPRPELFAADDSEMYELAYKETKKMMQIYTPEYCHRQTHFAALRFEQVVNELIAQQEKANVLN